MKLLLFLLFTAITFAQRDNTFAIVAKKPTERVTEAGRITFVKTLNSLQFERSVSPDIQQKLLRFMKQNRRNYTRLGTYTLHLVKRKSQLYVLEQRLPERLVLLD